MRRQQERENALREKRQAQATERRAVPESADALEIEGEDDGEDFEAFAELGVLLEDQGMNALGETALRQLCAQVRFCMGVTK